MKTIALLILVLFVIQMKLFSQIPPALDPNWVLQTNLSDEFDDTQIDLSKWIVLDSDPEGWTCGDFKSYNVWEQNGLLTLNAKDPSVPPYGLTTGAIKTINYEYLYGYYEIYAKLPGWEVSSGSGIYSNKGFWTAFWAYNWEFFDIICPPQTTAKPRQISGNEIDILEPSGLDASFGGEDESDGRTNEVGNWMIDNPDLCASDHTTKYGKTVIHNLPPLSQGYHKFAAECLPDRIIYYFDDVPFKISLNQPSYPTIPMRIVIDNQLQWLNCNFNSLGIQWDQTKYIIDYFRYYKLNNDCSNDINLLDNPTFISFCNNPIVKKNINIGNGINQIYLSIGDNKTLRATDNITIYNRFDVPLGSELNLIPTPCSIY